VQVEVHQTTVAIGDVVQLRVQLGDGADRRRQQPWPAPHAAGEGRPPNEIHDEAVGPHVVDRRHGHAASPSDAHHLGFGLGTTTDPHNSPIAEIRHGRRAALPDRGRRHVAMLA
jgi:hypothetical protein